jgi:hypothetical protein
LAAHSEKLFTHAVVAEYVPRGVGEPHHGGHQDVEHRLLLVDVVVEEPALQAEAGVVHQQLHRRLGLAEAGLDPGELGAVGEVGGQHLHRDAVRRAQLVGLGGQPGLVAGDQHQVVAAGGELVGERAADPGGGPGDQRGAAAVRGGTGGAVGRAVGRAGRHAGSVAGATRSGARGRA